MSQNSPLSAPDKSSQPLSNATEGGDEGFVRAEKSSTMTELFRRGDGALVEAVAECITPRGTTTWQARHQAAREIVALMHAHIDGVLASAKPQEKPDA